MSLCRINTLHLDLEKATHKPILLKSPKLKNNNLIIIKTRKTPLDVRYYQQVAYLHELKEIKRSKQMNEFHDLQQIKTVNMLDYRLKSRQNTLESIYHKQPPLQPIIKFPLPRQSKSHNSYLMPKIKQTSKKNSAVQVTNESSFDQLVFPKHMAYSFSPAMQDVQDFTNYVNMSMHQKY